MQIKSIKFCAQPPAYFNGPVYKCVMVNESGQIIRYFKASNEHEAKVKASKECDEYVKRQYFGGDPMNITNRRVT